MADTSQRTTAAPSPSLLIPLFLIAATVVAYWPILSNGFVRLDDPVTVYQNIRLTRLCASSFFSFWTSPYRDLYTPLTYSLFAAISLIARVKHHAGESLADPFYAWPFHATSLALHLISVLLVNALLRRLIRRPWPAAAGALLFALHPVQVESVAWVSETNNLLCGVLSFAALLMYLCSIDRGLPLRDRRGRFALATLLFIFAMLAKPLAVILPLLAGILYWIRPDDTGQSTSDSRNRVPWELTVWFILAVPIAIVARLGQPIPEYWLVVPLWLRPLVALDALAFYIGNILFPLTLVPDYDRSPAMIIQTHAVYYTWFVPLAGVWFVRRYHAKPLMAGMLWFVAALVPVLGLTPFAFQRMSTVADRYLYLPMFGVALFVAWVLSRVGVLAHRRSPPPDTMVGGYTHPTSEFAESKLPTVFSRLLFVLGVLVLVTLGIRTRLQCHYWHDTRTLFAHSLDVIGRTPGALEKAE